MILKMTDVGGRWEGDSGRRGHNVHLWLKVKVAQSCLTLCNPMDCSLPGCSVHGILQARILELAPVPFSRDLPNDKPRQHIKKQRHYFADKVTGVSGLGVRSEQAPWTHWVPRWRHCPLHRQERNWRPWPPCQEAGTVSEISKQAFHPRKETRWLLRKERQGWFHALPTWASPVK